MTEKKNSKPRRKPRANSKLEQNSSRHDAGEESQQVKDLLGPLLDFHRSVEEASKDDLRIFWDVRLVRGKDTPFAHIKGTSTLPKTLAYNMVAMAPRHIEEEITEKIVRPLVSVMQAEGERQTFAGLARQEAAETFGGEAANDLCEDGED
jgi:hypothetical protein